MTTAPTTPPGKANKPLWAKVVAKYQTPDTRAALWQAATSIVPYFLMQALMAWSLQYSYWLTLALSFLAAGFMMRVFIVLHDCGHGSFFKNQKWNDAVGFVCGVLTYTPYFHWRHSHAIHHASSGDLDRRGIGDVTTLTVREYNALPWHRRIGYRIYRHPIVMFLVGAPLLFLVFHRLPYGDFPARERHSVHWTTLAIAGLAALMMALMGWREYLLVQLPIMWIGTVVGVWMFYVQHQFEETYWKPHPEWDYYTASLKGSSYYKLPKLLQWFTGNIGFHHIHHLSPKIPNYRLEQCFRENPVFHDVSTLTLGSSFKTLAWRLWDEDQQRLVGFARAAEVSRLEKRQKETRQAQAQA
jgi:omega-6 fatty acid desaturase (delta-12 desaturase)